MSTRTSSELEGHLKRKEPEQDHLATSIAALVLEDTERQPRHARPLEMIRDDHLETGGLAVGP
jgi:hypothetical protein